MIDELYQLTVALDQAGIPIEHTHSKYKPIPKATKKAPCVHIVFDRGQIYKIESIEMQQATEIRKYGSNQGTFPALNLASLYRLTDETEKKIISDLVEGRSTDYDMDEIRRFCREKNWGKKFDNKYRICMQDVPGELTALFQKSGIVFSPLEKLIEEVKPYLDAAQLHTELESAAFAMLEQKREIAFALKILFYSGNEGKGVEEDYGTLSVVLDSRALMDEGLSVATDRFTSVLNQKLIEADAAAKKETVAREVDAFGQLFAPLEEPMPTVKLAAGFEVTLRTMFRGQPCQSRYGRIENATYPISREMRFKMQSALAWMGDKEHKEKTWISTDKDEALFAYPATLPKNMYSLVNFCKRPKVEGDKDTSGASGNKVKFETAAEDFIRQFRITKQPGTDPKSERIQYFVLRKLDKARTKVVYTYNTSPAEIEYCSEQWSLGCKNLPEFSFGQPATLFPLTVSDILNLNWRQDGRVSTEKFKPVPHYHGMQLLFGEKQPMVRRDLFVLTSNVTNLAPHLGKIGLARKEFDESRLDLYRKTWGTLALMGLLLYQLEIGKEKYMQEFPYLFGQLLKVSDALHELYCKVVRNNEVPNTLAGSGLYIAGTEQPYRTLALLGQRMNPYITWAKSYRTKDIQKKDEESWRAGWYLSLYESIAVQLYAVWGGQTRFNEEDKAQYFIGYLASFPKREKKSGLPDSSKDRNGAKKEDGGKENG